MADEGEERRAYYSAKIKQAEDLATRTKDQQMLRTLQEIAEGYRSLLERLPAATRH